MANITATAEALQHVSAMNSIGATRIPIWSLDAPATSAAAKAPSNTESSLHVNHGSESVIGQDDRRKVDPSDFATGGKYRSIVKLFCMFQKKSGEEVWMHGTGWLIRPDLLVTAGHCAFDWNGDGRRGYGRVKEVKAYIGYDCKKSIGTPDVQFRNVAKVATTPMWLAAKGNRQADVAFMQLDKPFKDVKPFKFAETEKSGATRIGVVGYPADLKTPSGENGAQMYEMFLDTTWDLEDSEWTMLEYQIDTFGGNSGSPVLRQDDNVSIGVHVYGGSPNSASVIGPLGNAFLEYAAAFMLHPEAIQVQGQGAEGSFSSVVPYVAVDSASVISESKDGIVDLTRGKFRQFSASQGFHNSGFSNGSNPRAGSNIAAEVPNGAPKGPRANGAKRVTMEGELTEGMFADIFKKAISIGAPVLGGVLKAGLPMAFGPLGGIIGSVAGTALNAAGRAASQAESSLVEPVNESAICQRAIYAEAALQSMLAMDKDVLQEEGFIDSMREITGKLMPAVKRVGPKLLNVVKDDVIQILLGQLSTGKPMPTTAAAEGSFVARKYKSSALKNLRTKTGEESFMVHVASGTESSEEGIFDIIKFGGKLLPPVIGGLGSLFGLSESSEVGDTEVTGALDGALERAVLAEAALQTAINLRHDVLEEEGFFDTFKNVIGTIGGAVVKYGPGVVKAVGPVVGGLVQQMAGESSVADEAFVGVAKVKKLRNKSSRSFIQSLSDD